MSEPPSTPASDATGGAPRWQFGQCVLDELSLELRLRGEPVTIELKPLELLLVLLRHAGEVVTKDELLEQVWPGRVPSESVLTKAMAKLRAAIGDEEQLQIRTVYGYGYKLAVPVTREAAAASAPPPTAFAAGDHPPLRPNWRLLHQLGGGRSDVWIGANDKTHERRVFKFAGDAAALRALKREITLFRILNDSGADPAGFVRLLDWNLDEPPYFVESEYADGGNLAEFIEARGGFADFPLERRLALLAEAASALGAAHDAGVLHKDLKPANLVVAVDGDNARVKLTDFGSGRMVDATRLAELGITRLGFTQTVAAIDSTSGTPLYLAPELLTGHAPTARSDIFALGVILYQLVIGDLRRPLAPGWEREVGDELLREDIAACCDTEPARRLATAAQLAERLATLAARRDRRAAERRAAAEAERLRARLERLRARRSAFGVLALVLLAGLAVVSTLLYRVRAAATQTTAALAEARAVADFLAQDVLAAASPEHTGRNDVPVRDLLEAASRRVDIRFASDPLRAAAVHRALGQAWGGIGDLSRADQELRAAIAALKDRSDGAAVLERITAGNERAELYYDHEDYPPARASLTALAAADAASGGEAAQPQLLYARALAGAIDAHTGKVKEGLAVIEAAYVEAVRRWGAEHPQSLAIEDLLANNYGDAGFYPRAEAELRSLLALRARAPGGAGPDLFAGRETLTSLMVLQGHERAALPELERLYAEETRAFGATDPHVMRTGNTLAVAYDNLGQPERARPLFDALIDAGTRAYGPDSNVVLEVKRNLATFYMGLESYDSALELERAIYAAYAKDGRDGSRTALLVLRDVGRCLLGLGRWREAVPYSRQVLERAAKSLPPTDALLAIAQSDLAIGLGHLGERPAAERYFELAIAGLTAAFGPEHRLTKRAIDERAAFEASPAKAPH